MDKCDFKGCPHKATVLGKISGWVINADKRDSIYDVQVCDVHSHHPELWVVATLEPRK